MNLGTKQSMTTHNVMDHALKTRKSQPPPSPFRRSTIATASGAVKRKSQPGPFRMKLKHGAHSQGYQPVATVTTLNPEDQQQFNRMMEHFTAIQTSSGTQSVASESPDLRAIRKQMDYIQHQNEMLNQRMTAKFSRSQSVKQHHRHSKQFMMEQMGTSQITHSLRGDVPAPRHSTGNIRDHQKRERQRERERDLNAHRRGGNGKGNGVPMPTKPRNERELRERDHEQMRPHSRGPNRDQRPPQTDNAPLQMIKPSMRHNHTSTSTVPTLPVIKSTDIQIKVMRTDADRGAKGHREKSPIPPIEQMAASHLRSCYTAGSSSMDSSFASSHSASNSSTSCSSSASSGSSGSCSSSGSSGSSGSSCSSSSGTSSCSGSSGSGTETTMSDSMHSSDGMSQTETDLSHVPCSCRQSHFKRPKVSTRNRNSTMISGTMASGSSSASSSGSSASSSSETTAICTCDEDR